MKKRVQLKSLFDDLDKGDYIEVVAKSKNEHRGAFIGFEKLFGEYYLVLTNQDMVLVKIKTGNITKLKLFK